MSDHPSPQEDEIELDESFDEQKRKVDEWTREQRREQGEEGEREPS